VKILLPLLPVIVGFGFLFLLLRRRGKTPFSLDTEAVEHWASQHFPEATRATAAAAACILIEQTGMALEELSADSSFSDINCYDDFDVGQFTNALEEAFTLKIPASDGARIKNLGTLIAYLHEHCTQVA